MKISEENQQGGKLNFLVCCEAQLINFGFESVSLLWVSKTKDVQLEYVVIISVQDSFNHLRDIYGRTLICTHGCNHWPQHSSMKRLNPGNSRGPDGPLLQFKLKCAETGLTKQVKSEGTAAAKSVSSTDQFYYLKSLFFLNVRL